MGIKRSILFTFGTIVAEALVTGFIIQRLFSTNLGLTKLDELSGRGCRRINHCSPCDIALIKDQ